MSKPLTLTIHTKDGDHTYTQEFIPLQKVLDAATMREPFEDGTNFNLAKWTQAHVSFVAKIFNISEKEIYDGVDARDLDKVIGIVNTILGIDPN